MAKVVFTADLPRYTDGVREMEIAASDYRALANQLSQRFPALTEALLAKYAIAVDGRVIQAPLLEKFDTDCEIIFVARIAGG